MDWQKPWYGHFIHSISVELWSTNGVNYSPWAKLLAQVSFGIVEGACSLRRCWSTSCWCGYMSHTRHIQHWYEVSVSWVHEHFFHFKSSFDKSMHCFIWRYGIFATLTYITQYYDTMNIKKEMSLLSLYINRTTSLVAFLRCLKLLY